MQDEQFEQLGLKLKVMQAQISDLIKEVEAEIAKLKD
jgi:hypothetical protein